MVIATLETDSKGDYLYVENKVRQKESLEWVTLECFAFNSQWYK